MIKKVIVKYDEIGKPVAVLELKDFTDEKLKAFLKECEVNEQAQLARVKAKEKTIAEEKEALQVQFSNVKSLVLYLLGEKELTTDEISKALESVGK